MNRKTDWRRKKLEQLADDAMWYADKYSCTFREALEDYDEYLSEDEIVEIVDTLALIESGEVVNLYA
jgi:hypothetical protein